MAVEAGKLQARSMKIINDDASIRGGGRYDCIKIAMRPFDVFDRQLVLLFCRQCGRRRTSRRAADDGMAEIELFHYRPWQYADCFEDLATRNDGVSLLRGDIQG